MEIEPDKKPAEAGMLRKIYVARQPILDRDERVYAYELLFRSGLVSIYDGRDGDAATRKVLADSYTQLGMATLTGGKPVFVNFTENLLLDEVPMAFPCNSLYVEVLETISASEPVIRACRRLKDAGYRIVLDDFVFYEKQRPLFEIADIVKVDFRITRGLERRRIVQIDPAKTFLAEKVETHEEFQQALDYGYELFQGHFFSKAFLVTGREVLTHKAAYFRLLREMQNPNIEFERLEEIIQQDVSLPYKLLHFINSASFGFSRIRSIRQALTLIGQQEMRKWLSVVILAILADDRPEVLITNSLVRARFCELLARGGRLGKDAEELFLLGLFSLIDALLDRPMKELLEELPLAEEIKAVLLGGSNRFSPYYDLALLYEEARWEDYSTAAQKIGLAEEEVPKAYFDALAWAEDAIHGTSTGQ